jgi:glucose/arabinose dehydrogenase
MKTISTNVINALCLLAFYYCSPPAVAQYSLSEAFPNVPAFSLPVELVQVQDGTQRWFVVQQRGIVYVLANDSTTSQRKIFMNMTGLVSTSGSETGLLGWAFHPNYATNRTFFVSYTRTVGGVLRSFISRFTTSTTNPDSGLLSSEQVLLNIEQPFSNHNGGRIMFGPDGMLYVSIGDGGSAGDPGNRAQNRSLLLGKILRISVDSSQPGLNYAIPPDNPYAQDTTNLRKEIWAFGLRNVWKMSFDVPTGRLWAGDVGQNQFEEISIIRKGENYGWRLMEAFNCYNPSSNCNNGTLTLPVFAYNHSANDASITGGFVYRGSQIPLLVGRYVYGDYISGRIWALQYDSIQPTSNQLLVASGFNISSFAQDSQGELYLLRYDNTNGRIYRLRGPATPTGFSGKSSIVPALSLYPNPAKETLQVVLTGWPGSAVHYTLVSKDGKTVRSGTWAIPADFSTMRTTLDTSGLSQGIYYLTVTSEGHIHSEKILVNP